MIKHIQRCKHRRTYITDFSTLKLQLEEAAENVRSTHIILIADVYVGYFHLQVFDHLCNQFLHKCVLFLCLWILWIQRHKCKCMSSVSTYKESELKWSTAPFSAAFCLVSSIRCSSLCRASCSCRSSFSASYFIPAWTDTFF